MYKTLYIESVPLANFFVNSNLHVFTFVILYKIYTKKTEYGSVLC